jgi:hypothetical protein
MKNETYRIVLSLLIVSAMILWYMINPPKNMPAQPNSANQRQFMLDPSNPLIIPPPNAPESEKIAHFEIVKQYAREAEQLSISNCTPDLAVFKTTLGKTFTVTNKDNSPHQIQISPSHLYDVPANGSLEIIADFGHGAGVYGYGCDNSTGPRGIFWVHTE